MANGCTPKNPVGEISDQHQPPDEKNAVQKRAFARWMNVFLQRCDPPLEVHDLFADVQDGKVLMALLEKLTGCRLLYRFRSSSHRIFRLNNISKALSFLDDRHVKLLGIDASGIADGIPAVVLNLIWDIILHFQVKEMTRGLGRHLSCSLSSLPESSYPSFPDLSLPPNDIGSYSCNTLPSKGRKAAKESKYHGKAIKTLLQWVQRCTSKFGVEVNDFGRSWRSGLAFLAVIKSINPDLVDLRESLSKTPKENLQHAFTTAHRHLDIAPLLEPEDVLCSSPDEQSIITYVSMFLGHCSDAHEVPTRYIEDSKIPNFGSVESVSFGETVTDGAEAQELFRGLEESNEQLLWRRWSRRSSGSPRTPSLHSQEAAASDVSSGDGEIPSSRLSQSGLEKSSTAAATLQFRRKSGRHRSILQPPSPLDARIVNPEIRSWMEKDSDQFISKSGVNESHFSLSSEEGIYILPVLDSDEEDAYSYILDLSKDVFQPQKRQVARVEEETVEEMSENGKHPETGDVSNGCGSKTQEGPFVEKADFKVREESEDSREMDLGKNERGSGEITQNRPVFDTQPEDESSSKEEPEEEGDFKGQMNDYSDHGDNEKEEETENARLVTRGNDKAEAAAADKTIKKEIFKMSRWQNEVEGEAVGRHSAKSTESENGVNTEEGEEKWEFEDRGGKESNPFEGEDSKYRQTSVGSEVLAEKDGVFADDDVYEEAGKEIGKKDTVHETQDSEGNADNDTSSMDFTTVEAREANTGQICDDKTTAIDHENGTTPNETTAGGVTTHAASFSSVGGSTLQSFAASCNITPLELEALVALWLLLYCYFILSETRNL